MTKNIMYALEIMGKGMTSIFAVILVLTLIVFLMAKLTEFKTKKNSREDA